MKIRCVQCGSEWTLPENNPLVQYNCPKCNTPLPKGSTGVAPGGPPTGFGRPVPPTRPPSKGMPAVAVVAIVVAVGMFFMIGMMAAIMLPALARAREAARRASCQNNLKQMGIVMKMYANESRGEAFPALSSEPGNLMMTGDAVYPEFMTDLHVLICPSDADDSMTTPTDVRDHSYWYLGYVVTNQAELEAFHKAYMRVVEEGGDFEDDLLVEPGTGTAGSDRIIRVREGVDVPPLRDPDEIALRTAYNQDEIPVMFERVGPRGESHHPEPGGHVLFMDGHVEFVPFGAWPYTEEALALFSEMDQLGEVTPNE